MLQREKLSKKFTLDIEKVLAKSYKKEFFFNEFFKYYFTSFSAQLFNIYMILSTL